MLDTIDATTKLRYAGKAIGLGGQTAAGAVRVPLQALKLGGRTAARKPGWTARAMRVSMGKSPMWPWERRRAQRRITDLLPEQWPWEARREPERSLTAPLLPLMAGMAIGGLLMYFLDPRMGQYRRERLLRTVGIQRGGRAHGDEHVLGDPYVKVEAEGGVLHPVH